MGVNQTVPYHNNKRTTVGHENGNARHPGPSCITTTDDLPWRSVVIYASLRCMLASVRYGGGQAPGTIRDDSRLQSVYIHGSSPWNVRASCYARVGHLPFRPRI